MNYLFKLSLEHFLAMELEVISSEHHQKWLRKTTQLGFLGSWKCTIPLEDIIENLQTNYIIFNFVKNMTNGLNDFLNRMNLVKEQNQNRLDFYLL